MPIVFASGFGGVILRYDGLYWRELESGTESNLNGIGRTGYLDVFAVGEGTTRIVYNKGLDRGNVGI
ncbi:MAG: hypothetical protein DRR08_29650 [Candidatus Parabeggiatoa sp. nov. 2]|nr:MAG: hypothetical protein DRR08_29650 [Gammaproteobacteria bacterium]